MAARRMSRIVKMGVCSAIKCIRDSGIENPDAIITGTGMGCLEDTEKFLLSLYENQEKLLNPTPFIQSTHNTVGASIAMLLKCNNYNNTFGHRGFSFENTLLDGMMLLNEGKAENILVGAVDELTSNLFSITDRLGFWKKSPLNNLKLLHHPGKGTIAGEGTAFFALGKSKSERSFARVGSILTFFNPAGFKEIESRLSHLLVNNIIESGTIDLIICGINGDPTNDDVYFRLGKSIFSHIPIAWYKHLCGEYDTSSSFALNLAAGIIREQSVPPALMVNGKFTGEINNILIYNHLRNLNHSAIMVSKC
jgi:hypothetical protein